MHAVPRRAPAGCGGSSSASRTGRDATSDIDLLKNVADNIEGNTICALGDAAAWPVQSFVKKFRDEFQAHVDAGKCTVLTNA